MASIATRRSRATETATHRWRLLRLLPDAGRGPLIGFTLALSAKALTAPIQAIATGWLIGEIGTAHYLEAVLAPIATLAFVLLAGQLSESLADHFRAAAAARIDGQARIRVREVALAQDGIGLLETAGFRDEAALASGLGVSWRLQSPGAAATGQFLLLFRFLGAAVAALVLARFFPLLAIVLLLASLVMRAILRRQWVYLAALNDGLVGEQRRSEYWADLVGAAPAAKEIRLFGLADWSVARRLKAYLQPTQIMWTARRDVIRHQGPTTALAAGSALLALAVPGLAATRGHLGAGALASCLVAAWGIFQIGLMGFEAYDIEAGLGAVRALDRLVSAHPRTWKSTSGMVLDRQGPPLVRFENVQFSYPDTRSPVLRGLDLEISPGEILAVVGVNGAGKTTLIKLLSGLYTPTSGRITVDGHDLRQLQSAYWCRRLSAIFQDFVCYPTTIRDNVALSAPEHLDDVVGIEAALRRAGADGLAEGLSDGIHTRLWRGGTGGVDLSGGQWQRLAIARALFAADHGRQILVLDEPTAHLDVQAEADFYDRVIATTAGVSVMLISHRLSTVRRADRIVVLDGGRVIESGTHDQLVENGGQYARMFGLQAARFLDAVSASEEVRP